MTGRLLDHAFMVHVDPGADTPSLRALFDGFRTEQPEQTAFVYSLTRDGDGAWVILAGGTHVHRSARLQDAVVALEWHVVNDILTARADVFHTHAASLSSPFGPCSILLPGASGSGKTTLTLALMAHGFLPYADDVTVVAPATLEPATVPRAFHLDDHARRILAAAGSSRQYRLRDLPAGHCRPRRWATQSWPLRVVLFPSVDAARPPRVVRLSMAEAVTQIASYSASLHQSPELALAVAARLAAEASCFTLRVGAIRATATLVCDVVREVACTSRDREPSSSAPRQRRR